MYGSNCEPLEATLVFGRHWTKHVLDPLCLQKPCQQMMLRQRRRQNEDGDVEKARPRVGLRQAEKNRKLRKQRRKRKRRKGKSPPLRRHPVMAQVPRPHLLLRTKRRQMQRLRSRICSKWWLSSKKSLKAQHRSSRPCSRSGIRKCPQFHSRAWERHCIGTTRGFKARPALRWKAKRSSFGRQIKACSDSFRLQRKLKNS
mmetsp:Transcript_36347/g.65999  ORF Transcript_36347/g.65999 Transcript_36347/m.65999 type:complete len:200 (+) Transcript_36347:854-1453(+)